MHSSRWRTAVAAAITSPLLMLGIAAVAPTAANATTLTCPTEPTSWGNANMISYNDSDTFGVDGTNATGDWQSSSNATVTQGTGTTMLHTTSLKDTVPAAGSSVVKLGCVGSGGEIPVTAGNSYRIGAYVNVPRTGGTVTWAFGTYDSGGNWKGWVSGSADTVANTGYQWYPNDITIPTGVTNVIGVRETVSGMQANDVIRTDEVLMHPTRPALVMGQNDSASFNSATWDAACQGTSSTYGPCQENKMFYSGTLPTSYTGSNCASLPANVTCVIAFKTNNATDTTDYVSSIPATRHVIFVYHQEPENGDYTSGATFVSEFETASNAIRTAAGNAPNVMVAMDSSGSGYGNGHPGADCSYVVPQAYTDAYLYDAYQQAETGNPYASGQYATNWTNYSGCVKSANSTTVFPKPFGFGEEGWSVNSTGCPSAPAESVRASSLAAEGTWLQTTLPSTYGAPAIDWNTWNVDNTGTEGACHDYGPWPATSTTTSNWVGLETQNGGGA